MFRCLSLRRFPFALPAVLFAGLLSLALLSCQATPGPVQPAIGAKAPGVIVIDPALVAWLDVPNGEQYYHFNQGGFLEYTTVVRNRGAKAMTLTLGAFFQDETGSVTEEQDSIRFFIEAQTEKPLQIAANDRRSKKMRVQIRPAR